MNRSVTRKGSRFPAAFGVGLAVGICVLLGIGLSLGAFGSAAADATKAITERSSATRFNEGGTRLKNGIIAYEMTHKFWALYETPAKDGKTIECPTGMNDGPREQFRTLYGDGKGPKKYTIAEAQLKREGDLWHPSTTPEPPQLTFKEAQGKVSYGMNLDGKNGPNDFESPEGVKGVDNQLYRAIGCIGNYRTMGTINHFEDLFMNSYNDARVVVELSNVKSLESSDDVTVNIYRGSNRMVADSTGEGYLPGGTQHVDVRWGRQFISHTKGKIVDGVLTTDPIDRAELPWGSTFGTHAYHVFRGLRLQLKLTDGTAKGLLAGYVDVDAFIHHLNTSWSTHHQSYGQLSSQSLYREISRLADGYPDAKTGKNTAISSAVTVEFAQVYLVKPEERKQLTAATGVASGIASQPYWQPPGSKDKEAYVSAPMPPGVQVVDTENEGPVFANADGKTLYTWPLSGLRNGQAGDRRNSGHATCDETIYKETTGFMSPYPGGFLLPEPETRKSCEALWPPFLAPADAKPVGKWTTVMRTNGESQWAYDGFPVYISSKDHKKGDVLGGSNSMSGGAMGAVRYPIGPNADIPPDLRLAVLRTGRMLVTHKGFSVYAYDKDTPGKSNCTGECLDTWSPVVAAGMSKAEGDWSIIERSPGIRQWAYRGQPLYTNINDSEARQVIGTDIPGWHNVYTQRALAPPSDWTVQDADLGQVLADSRGKTIYYYSCNDDAMDQQSCDSPDAPQVYRLAICGNFDPKVCNETFPYVRAQPGETAASPLWSVISIDPDTGRLAQAGQAGALQVWAYRERPVYTYGGDNRLGSVDGDNFGEFNGERNGFRAFWLRDDFRGNAHGRSPGDRR